MKIVVFTAVNKIDAIFFLGHKRKIDERYEEKGCKRKDKGSINLPKDVQCY